MLRVHADAEALRDYYDRRAREYEAIYRRDDPVRQGEQTAIAEAMRVALAGRRVLELACGTGYWTARLADVARSVVGVDASPRMLSVACAKGPPHESVAFLLGDAYRLPFVAGAFDGALANFWLSHVPRARTSAFLADLHAHLAPGAVVAMADNVYVPGVGGELVTRPGTHDTFKRRRLADGSAHEVLKNYYDADQLQRLLAPLADGLHIHVGRCFWWVTYRVRVV